MSPDERCNRLAVLLDQYGSALALFATQWTDSPDDCVQEALIRLAGQVSWPVNDVAWLYRVVKNEAISQSRASYRRRWREQFAARLRPELSEAESSIDREILAGALESLESSLREILIAKVWGRLTLEQIADAFGLSKSSAHRRYEQALAALRKQLGVPCKTTRNATHS